MSRIPSISRKKFPDFPPMNFQNSRIIILTYFQFETIVDAIEETVVEVNMVCQNNRLGRQNHVHLKYRSLMGGWVCCGITEDEEMKR